MPADAERPPTGDDPGARGAASERWARLPEGERSFIQSRLKRAERLADSDRIARRPDSGPAPLSYAQEGLWFLHRLESGHLVYNRAWGLQLTGPLDRGALGTAFNQIVDRHETLRTSILEVDGAPRQFGNPPQPVDLPLLDLSTLQGDEQQARIAELIAESAQKPFDLTAGLLIRPALVRLGPTDHLLVLIAHRIVIDAWSAHVLTRELSLLYEASVAGETSPLEPLPCQYSDFASWQRGRLQGEILEGLAAFWKAQLAGELPVLRLPSDWPKPAAATFRAACQRAVIPAPLRDALRALAGGEESTLYMVLLAAFSVLLSRHSQQEEIMIGTPVAGRSRLETEAMIGLFLNTLVLRTDLAGDPPFREFLGRVRRVAFDAFAHQDLPFEKLVEMMRPGRGPDRSPLFQVLFNLENVPAGGAPARSLRIEEIDFETGYAQYDLSLEIVDQPDGLACSLRYHRDVFDDQAMRRMLDHYRTLLEGIVEDPDRPVSRLPLLTRAERHQLLAEWSTARADNPDRRCVHELVEAQSENTPHAAAIVAPQGQVTYAELNARANQLARVLRARGVGPGIVVGIFAERSLEMVIGLLGILKSGGAYLALDPHYPRARLDFMLRDSGVRLILSQENVLSGLPGFDGEVFCLDRDGGALAREEVSNLAGRAAPGDLAYVVYTSGSTGVPKGVPIAHRGVVNYLAFLAAHYPLDASDVVLQLASPSFDMSVREFFGPLAAGAKLALVRGLEARDPDRLLSRIEELRVTASLGVVPTLLNSLTAAAARRGGDYASVRLLMTGGEPLTWEILEKARRAFPGASTIVNQYGPAEITMICAHYRAPDALGRRASATVPIGRPVPNTEIYILDRHLEPVPIGVPGELVVGGVGVSRGYLHRPDLTAERFLPNPFRGGEEGRLYRTGDLSRFLSDGNIEFLGRMDHQVKVRGYRVEPGEIEAVLGRHPSVHQAAVTAEEDPGAGARLAAFVVARPGQETRPAILREFLRERLPDFMIPASITQLEAMPLTPSGKVDRQALPASDQRRPDLPIAFVGPSSPVESSLVKIWSELLGVEKVGVHDNFFDLGGHSLLATRVIARIRDELHVELDLRQFFDAEPTIARIAEQIDRLRRGEAKEEPEEASEWSCLVPIQPAGSRPPLFCIHWAGGHVIIYRDLARHLGPDQPVYGLQAVGLDGRRVPHTRLEDMAAYYVQEVRRLQPSGPYHLAGASMGGKIAFEMAQRIMEQGEPVGLLALIDTTADVERPALPLGERVQLHSTNVRRLGPGYLVHRARVRLRRWIYGWVIRMGWPLPRFMRNLKGISYVAAHNYHPRSYPGKVTLFRAAERPRGGTRDFFLGWDRVAGGGMDVFEIPGTHISLMLEPGVRLLAQELQRCLDRGRGEGPGP